MKLLIKFMIFIYIDGNCVMFGAINGRNIHNVSRGTLWIKMYGNIFSMCII